MTKRIVASRGAWVAQSAERLASAQIMVSQSVSSSPASGSVQTAQSLEPALDSGSPSLSALPPLVPCLCLSKINNTKKIFKKGGCSWVAQSVERLTSAQVMISWFVSSSPTSGSMLTVQSLEPALDSLSPSLSLYSSPACALSLKNK